MMYKERTSQKEENSNFHRCNLQNRLNYFLPGRQLGKGIDLLFHNYIYTYYMTVFALQTKYDKPLVTFIIWHVF